MAVSFFALFDDIASMMDDVALMTKAATKKTVGVLGDDLALNANQLTGVQAKRELPVVWAVTKGSLVNKAILVPVALLLSAFYQPALFALLMLGGAYLCYEGMEKVVHTFIHHEVEKQRKLNHVEAVKSDQDLLDIEKDKIRGAIITDFVLSAEIIVIAMGVVVDYKMPISEQAVTLSIIALMVTFFIYGVVAIIIKIDDVGKYWVENKDGWLDNTGHFLLWLAPNIIKVLSIVGTAAMFIVGGHIWVERIGFLHHFSAGLHDKFHGIVHWFISTGFDVFVGLIVGGIIYVCLTPVFHWWQRRKANESA